MKEDIKKLDQLQKTKFNIGLFILFLLIIIGVAIYIITLAFIHPEDQEAKTFDYSINNHLDYKVYLHDNNFFEDEYLNSGQQYTSELVDYIEIDFSNYLKLSDLSVIKYRYDIKAEVIGKYGGDTNTKEEVWNKKFNLNEPISETINKNNNVEIKDKIIIDYNKYNKMAVDFKTEFRMNIDALLSVTVNVHYDIEVEDEIVSKEQTLKVDIPLLKTAFKIGTNVPDKYTETVSQEAEEKILIPNLVIGILFLFLALVLGMVFVKQFLRINKKAEYTVKLNKILKAYGEIVAQSENLPNIKKLDVIDIAKFEDMVDIESELRIPIIYYEKKASTEGWFILINGNQAYRYILFDKEPKKTVKKAPVKKTTTKTTTKNTTTKKSS